MNHFLSRIFDSVGMLLLIDLLGLNEKDLEWYQMVIRTVIVFIFIWLVLQGFIGLTGFYQTTQSFPPRFVVLIGPGLILSVLLLLTKRGRHFIDSLNVKRLTILHAVRIPAEITLYFVYTAKYMYRH